MTRVGVVTVCHGRLDHLRRVQEGLSRVGRDLDWVVVAVDDPAVERWRPAHGVRPSVVSMPAAGPLPVGAARNLGARHARARGADLLVFLDVDCVPAPEAIDGYVAAAGAHPDALLCGPVAYLPPAPEGGYDLDDLAALAEPHPARPAPAPGRLETGGDPDLFWSLSFAVAVETWRRLGGFCDRYRGYGAEDTDLGRKAALLGIDLVWVGSARAFHQHHPVSDPPVEHLDDILRNGAVFARRWGAWPMGGWLERFAEHGLVHRTDAGWVRAV